VRFPATAVNGTEAASNGPPDADVAGKGTGAGDAAGGVRVDTHLQAGATVPPYYDSLLAKVIARGSDRARSLATLRGALDRCVVDGVTTNLELHRALLADPEFASGDVDTSYLARWLARGPRTLAPAGPESAWPASGGHETGAEQAASVRNQRDLDPEDRGDG
jgi:acetyl/propionyl-CoA carboxylase alpha subunit